MTPTDGETNWTPAVPPFSPDTIIEDIICSYPDPIVRTVFEQENLHCFNCVVGPEDTLRDVARLHNKDLDHLIQQLSEHFANEPPHDEPAYYE